MMPKSVAEILAHGDELARRFEEHEMSEGQTVVSDSLAQLRAAVETRSRAERDVLAAVIEARRSTLSWAVIGAMLGTTGEAARQRYKEADAAVRRRNEVSDQISALLSQAEFTREEIQEFAGLLNFSVVLSEAGHSGAAGGVVWTKEKTEAMAQVIALVTGVERRSRSAQVVASASERA